MARNDVNAVQIQGPQYIADAVVVREYVARLLEEVDCEQATFISMRQTLAERLGVEFGSVDHWRHQVNTIIHEEYLKAREWRWRKYLFVGLPLDEKRCTARVSTNNPCGPFFKQCSRRPAIGDVVCAQHKHFPLGTWDPD
eukprot:9863057-Karenia_brevis.AAC.1